MDRHFVSWSGLERLSRLLYGSEKIGFGIRPHGFHAGNMAAIVAYPWLLCERMEKLGITPQFRFDCWINDLESPGIVGSDGSRATADPVSMLPEEKTFQCTLAPNGFSGNLADYWQPLVENAVLQVHQRFPETRVTFHRTSEMTNTKEFAKTVAGAIRHADDIARAAGDMFDQIVYGKPEFVRPVCPTCETPVKGARVEDNDEISAHCGACETHTIAPADKLRWWTQFRILTVPRMALGRYDVWMMGADHLAENQFGLRSMLADLFKVRQNPCDFLYAPVALADKNSKMGKSNHNATYVPLPPILELLRNYDRMDVNLENAPSSEKIQILGDLVPRHIAKPSIGTTLRLGWEHLRYSLLKKKSQFAEDNLERPDAANQAQRIRNIAGAHV
jgi:hypothetical protein